MESPGVTGATGATGATCLQVVFAAAKAARVARALRVPAGPFTTLARIISLDALLRTTRLREETPATAAMEERDPKVVEPAAEALEASRRAPRFTMRGMPRSIAARFWKI